MQAMHVKKLVLEDYRNYQKLAIDIAPELTFFYGNNAQGKTNILEALYVLSTTQSPRTLKAQDLVKWGSDRALLEAHIATRTGDHVVMMDIKKNGEKTISIDHQFLKRSSDLLGKFPMIFFSPDDLEVIKKAPQGRRHFMDLLFSQTNSKYAYYLRQFFQVIKQRNECLKQIFLRRTDASSLIPWNEALIETGFYIADHRRNELPKLITAAEDIHGQLTEDKEKLTLKYISSLDGDKDRARQKLKENQDHEIASQRTLFGPHRDDLLILVNEREAKAFASHGQQRTAMISLKMAEIRYMEQEFGERPIVLLDDILLELDPQRFQALLQTLFEKTQTIMTGTEQHRFLQSKGAEGMLYQVDNGKIMEMSDK